MGDTWVTDLRHFLDDDGFFPSKMPAPARKIAEHTAAIVEAATARLAGEPWTAAALSCRRRPGRKPCPGHVTVRRTEVPAEIVWRCSRCDDNGVIHGFEGTVWDLSPEPKEGPSVEVRVRHEELRALLDASSDEIDLHVFVVGARDDGKTATIDVPTDAFEPFVDAVAGAANHASGKTRALLDAVLDHLDAEASEPQEATAQRSSEDGIGGVWRIEHMEVWGRDYLDMEVEAHLAFDDEASGSFQFGLVRGDIHYERTRRDGKPAIEWSWAGADESDEASGRGWAIVDGDKMRGRIYIHRGDDSAFIAVRRRTSR